VGQAAARAAAALFVCLACGGCGYSLSSNLPAHIQTVAVPVFVNRTQEPAVEDVITRGIVDAFTTNGRLRVVRAEQADSILEGEIVGYQLQALSFDQRANVREYRLVVTLNLRFRDVRSNEMLLQERGVQEKADFRTAAGNVTIAREDAALRQAATDIGRAVVSLALQRF
jgi:outer membrane lipopolysaccharide assembly protein LptE/RlpB